MTAFELTRIRPSVLWRETDRGVLVEHGSRSFEMRGAKVYGVVSRLLPILDGTRSLEDIRNGLPDPVRPLFDRLLGELKTRAMLTAGGPVPEEASDVPAEVIRLMQDRCEDWRSAARSWCDRDVAIVAPRRLATKVERHCSDLRLRSIRICEPDPEAAPPAASLLIWLATDLSNARRAALAKPRGAVVAAGLRGPMAAVFSGDREDLAHLPAVLDKLPDLDEQLSDVALDGLCALIAHEALALHLRRFRDAGRGDSGDGELRLMRRDGSVRRIQLDAALLSDGPFDVDRAALADVAMVEPPLAPLFDRDSRLLSWADDQDMPVPYPLFHRSIALAAFGEPDDRSTTIREWGLTPDEADRRTIGSAMRAIARRHETQPPSVDCSPILAAADEAEAIAIGRAHLAARKHGLWHRDAQQPVELESDCDRDLATMVRLARLFDEGRMPKLRVGSDPEHTAFVATAEIGGRSATRLAITRDRALYEAMGAILSAAQRGGEIEACVPIDDIRGGNSLRFQSSDALEFEAYGWSVGRVLYE